MKSKDRCSKCGVLLDKPWMCNAHRCILEGRLKKKFIKQLIATEAILITYVVVLWTL